MTELPITHPPVAYAPGEAGHGPNLRHGARIARPQRLKSRAEQARLCRRITFVTACMLVPVVLGRRLLGAANPAVNAIPGPRNRHSVFMEARADAGAIIPWIFMG